MSRIIRRSLSLATLLLVALVLAHELVFLARYGSRFGEALIHSGHGETWSRAVLASVALAAGLAVAASARLVWLSVQLRRRRGHEGIAVASAPPIRSLLHSSLRLAPASAGLTVALLSLQENLERLAIGESVPGPLVLASPEYAGGIVIAAAVGLAAGLIAALFLWRHDALVARLRAARPAVPRRTSIHPRRTGVLVSPPSQSLLGRSSALRAPPLRAALI